VVLDLITTITDDGCSAEVPSINGCECWAHEEEEAIEKLMELLRFYVNLHEDTEIKVDRARRNKNRTVYKIVFDKFLS